MSKKWLAYLPEGVAARRVKGASTSPRLTRRCRCLPFAPLSVAHPCCCAASCTLTLSRSSVACVLHTAVHPPMNGRFLLISTMLTPSAIGCCPACSLAAVCSLACCPLRRVERAAAALTASPVAVRASHLCLLGPVLSVWFAAADDPGLAQQARKSVLKVCAERRKTCGVSLHGPSSLLSPPLRTPACVLSCG